MVDIGLARDRIVALFDFALSTFKLFRHVALALLGLCQLDFDVAK